MRQVWKYKFTVLTPSYNRAHTLPRVYESLKRQSFRDFEWLIIDDGSTDGTKDLIAEWQKESFFPIRYIWQCNAHKKAAFNRGVKEANGELLLTLDSDDEALPNALEIFCRHWSNIQEEQRKYFSAVTGLCKDEKGDIVGDVFPQDIFDSDSLEMRYRYRVTGEKWGFHRTDVLRKFPFPENVNGHVPESVVWSLIASQYKTRFVNDILRVYRAEDDSLSIQDTPSLSADGLALWTRETLVNEWRWFHHNPKWFFKTAANYTRFHWYLKKNQQGKNWPLRGVVPFALMIIMWPVGTIKYFLDEYFKNK